MGKLVKPSQLPVHRGLDDRIATRLLVPRLPDDLNKAGCRLLALPLGERLIEPAEELSQRIRHSVLTGQKAPTQHDDGPASPATCNVTSVAFGIAAGSVPCVDTPAFGSGRPEQGIPDAQAGTMAASSLRRGEGLEMLR